MSTITPRAHMRGNSWVLSVFASLWLKKSSLGSWHSANYFSSEVSFLLFINLFIFLLKIIPIFTPYSEDIKWFNRAGSCAVLSHLWCFYACFWNDVPFISQKSASPSQESRLYKTVWSVAFMCVCRVLGHTLVCSHLHMQMLQNGLFAVCKRSNSLSRF